MPLFRHLTSRNDASLLYCSRFGSAAALVVICLSLLHVGAAVRYVSVANGNGASPYLSWDTAAANIQAAVDASGAGDEIIVSDGVYAVGQTTLRGLDRVAVSK